MSPFLIIVCISVLWVIVWIHFVFKHETSGTSLPSERPLIVCGSLLLTNVILFYIILYLSPTQLFLLPTSLQIVLLVSVFGAAMLVMYARAAISKLSVREVLFSINPILCALGPYQHLRHPMFFGIGYILMVSWILLPNLLALPWLFLSLGLLYAKARIEEHKALQRRSD